MCLLVNRGQSSVNCDRFSSKMCFKSYAFSIFLLSILFAVNSIELNRINKQLKYNDFIIGNRTETSRLIDVYVLLLKCCAM